MIPLVLFFMFIAWVFRAFAASDNESRVRFKFIYNFIILYEKKTGIRLTSDQAIALIQVTIAHMQRQERNESSFNGQNRPPQEYTLELCMEAERKAQYNL